MKTQFYTFVLGFLASLMMGGSALAAARQVATCSSSGTVSATTYTVHFERVRFNSATNRGNAFYIFEASGGVNGSFKVDADDLQARFNETTGELVALRALKKRTIDFSVGLVVQGRQSKLEINFPANEPASKLNIVIGTGLFCASH